MKGVTATREIFEKAIDVLPDEQAKFIILAKFSQIKYLNLMNKLI